MVCLCFLPQKYELKFKMAVLWFKNRLPYVRNLTKGGSEGYLGTFGTVFGYVRRDI